MWRFAKAKRHHTYSLFTITYYLPKITNAFLVKSEKVISKNPERFRIRDFWRYRPDLNWRMRVLQTLALPLGHGTVWSGWRGSNSLPPPWQGGALPDELHPQIWCLRSELNQRHADFQSAALPTELQRHMRKKSSSLRKFATLWRPRTDSNRRPPAWQAGVLTDCTTGPNLLVGTTGLEPVTSCL